MTPNPYDQVTYTNRPYGRTHPDHLFVQARLRGLTPPPVETARVLDLGASEGGNIIPMAFTLPHAQFTGIDLAGVPVERGCAFVRDLGLSNVRLQQMNLLDVDASFGEFDYIIAHGLYAWTPPVVRDKVLEIMHTNLSPHGIGFVSYNTLPGGHIRRILRDIMLARVGTATAPSTKLRRAREALRLLAEYHSQSGATPITIGAEAKEVLALQDSALFHDYLADIYEPTYLRDFVDHAARHQLAYVDDASVLDRLNYGLKDEATQEVARMAPNDRVQREQLLDHLRVRRFRQSLVCRATLRPSEVEQPELLRGMWVASTAQETGEGKFQTIREITMTTRHPEVIDLLRRLAPMWPNAEPIGDNAAVVWELFRRAMVEVRALPGVAQRAGDRPAAARLARFQAARGEDGVSTLDHRWIEIADQPARNFFALLDGSHDRDALASAMSCSRGDIDGRLEKLTQYAVMTA